MYSYPRGKGPKPHLNGDSIKKKRGRPAGTGKDPEERVMYHILVSERVKDMLETWKRRYRAVTYDQAIKSFSLDKIEFQKKVEAHNQDLKERELVWEERIESHLRIQEIQTKQTDVLEAELERLELALQDRRIAQIAR
jgi:hypothetical protein